VTRQTGHWAGTARSLLFGLFAMIRDRKRMHRALRPEAIGSKTRNFNFALRNRLNEGPSPMRNRRTTLLWMKDLIEHMSRCHDQLEWASDGETQTFLANALLGDLSECRKLCEQLRTGPGPERRTRSLITT
jgi:hypothetical protein